MKNKPAISIITPAYNAGDFITEMIQSVQRQDFNDYEHIIVDDGSTDSTLSIVQNAKDRDSRIKVISQKNMGPANARNTALERAEGRHVLFLDSDDYLAPSTLGTLNKRARASGADIVYYNFVTYFGDDQSNWITHRIDLPTNKTFAQSELSKKIFNVLPILSAGKLIKASIIEKHKLRFKEKYKRGEDVDFGVRLVTCAKTFAYVNHDGYFYRVDNPNSETATNHTEPTQLLQVLIDLDSLVSSRNKNLKKSFDNYAMEQIYGCITRQEGHPGAHKKAFDFASSKVIPKLGIDKLSRGDTYKKELYDFIHCVAKNDYTGALLERSKHLEGLLVKSDSAVRKLDVALADARRVNNSLESELAKMQASLSWRITRPLRQINKLRRAISEER